MNYLSEKFNFERTENKLSKLLQTVKSKSNFLDLTASNPTLIFKYEQDKIRSSLLKNESFTYKPDPQGFVQARIALVNYYKQKGREMVLDNFFFTSGTSEAMSFILKAISNPESEIFLPRPGYPLYDFIFKLENSKSKNYTLYPLITEDPNKLQWRIDFQNLEKNITENTKAIVIVEPHNPTGVRLTLEDAAKLTLLAKSKNLILIIDEVFSDYYSNYYKLNPYSGANCIYLNGLSKTLALPQMKLSWIYLSGEPEFIEQMKEALEIISDTYLSVNTPIQVGLENLLETASNIQEKIKNQIYKNCETIIQKLKDNSSIQFFLPEGGWYMLLKLKNNLDDETFTYRLLKEQFVYVHPGYMFDMPDEGYIVISLLPSKNIMQEGIKRLIDLIKKI